MELSSNKAGLILLTLIVTVSGCADNSSGTDVTVSQTEGVAIEGFSASPSEIFEGQLTTLEIQLRNVGGAEAQDVVARLFNRGFTGDGTWNIQADDSSVSEAKRKHIETLEAPDPQTDAPSISVPRTWNLEAPDLDVAQQVPYDFFARVFYKYSTTANTEIQVMSNERYNELGVTRSQPSLENSGGPIQVDVRTQTPIVFTNTGQDTQPVPIRVVVTNEGEGTPFLQSAYDDENYNVNEQNSGRVELEITAAGDSVSFDSNNPTVRMVNGEGVKSFTMNVDRVSSEDIQQTVPITVTANYGYYKDTSTSITVNGRVSDVTDNSEDDGESDDDSGEDTQDDPEDTSDSDYEWTGDEDQKDQQMSNYEVDTVDELCQNLIDDEALAAENCEEN